MGSCASSAGTGADETSHALTLTRDYVQLMFHRDLTNQIAHTNRYWTDQNLFTIFRYPNDVRF